MAHRMSIPLYVRIMKSSEFLDKSPASSLKPHTYAPQQTHNHQRLRSIIDELTEPSDTYEEIGGRA